MRLNQYLDGSFRQVECSGQLAPAGPRHVVLSVELFLQASDLFTGKCRTVSPHLIGAGTGSRAAQRRTAAVASAASMQTAEARAGGRRRGACDGAALRVP